MALVAGRPHNMHGSSVFIRDDVKVNNISVCEEENVELSTVELHGVVYIQVQPKQPVTHTQRETIEIILQCIMEEGIQPGSHLCIFKHFGYV